MHSCGGFALLRRFFIAPKSGQVGKSNCGDDEQGCCGGLGNCYGGVGHAFQRPLHGAISNDVTSVDGVTIRGAIVDQMDPAIVPAIGFVDADSDEGVGVDEELSRRVDLR